MRMRLQCRSTECLLIVLLLMCCHFESLYAFVTQFSATRKQFYRDKIKSMFYHAYNGYLNYAYPLDELRPLTCTGMDTWGSFSLTLIDALDTLVILGNHTEFQRAVQLVLRNVKVDENVNVSVFETNIRVIGGLLSAHMLSGRVEGYPLHPGWPCAGPLLDLAERFAAKLLPAFNTATGMPYGTVNLRHGVHVGETPITCTAGVGSFILEFGTLSRLTGNPHYERVALKALTALWQSRSALGLVGNHINVQTGVWTATDAGIGAGVDSYYEYLVKGALLFQRPLLMHQFYEYEQAINQHVRKEDWFIWVTMTKGHVSLPIFQSLEAFYPGILALMGKVEDAARIMYNYNQILRQYGVPPEFYHLPNREAHNARSGYPLRPEVAESLVYLYKATGDPAYLHAGAAIIETIERTAKTKCGYATIRSVTDFTLEDRMESFFLSETAKYLYLLFDDDNFIHNDGATARVVETTDGRCVVDAGGYIFNTEAHPIDPGIVYCCGRKRQNDTERLRRFEDNVDLLALFDLDLTFPSRPADRRMKEADLDQETVDLGAVDDDELVTLSNAERELVEGQRAEFERTNESDNPPETLSIEDGHVVEDYDVASEPIANGSNQDANNKDGQAIDNARSNESDDSEKVPARKDEDINLAAILQEVVKKLQERPPASVREPFIQALCDKCCPLLHRFQKGSLATRRLANAFYGRLLGRSTADPRLRFIHGPACDVYVRPAAAVKMGEPLAARFRNEPPDITLLDSEEQMDEDVVDGYSFGSILYRRLTAERDSLLSSSAPGFTRNFLGLGQIIPAA